jgi:hypothetical protein
MAKKATMAKASPKGGKKGCLCKDGKYSSECCDGTLPAQGIGSELGQSVATINHVVTERVISEARG